jgi:hypothetical protein
MRTVNTSRRAVAIAFVGAALIGLTVAGFELARSVLDEKWDRTEEVLRQMEEYRKGTPSARAFIDPQTWRVTVGYATFGIEPTVNPPQPGEDLEAMRKVIRKLLDERRQKVLLSAKIVHIPVREGSVLDLERLCGEHLILTSTGTVTLSRERFSKAGKPWMHSLHHKREYCRRENDYHPGHLRRIFRASRRWPCAPSYP